MNDVPVVGLPAPEPDPRPPRRSGLAAGAAVAAIIAAMWVIGGDGTDEGEAPPDLTVPTTSLPPTDVVERTLDWSDVTGLEDVTRIGDLIDVEGLGVLALATDSDGLSVYRSGDGSRWERVIVLADDLGTLGSVVGAAVDGMPLVAVNTYDPVSGTAAATLWHSVDGVVWSRSTLPSLDATAPGSAGVDSVFARGDQVTLYGFSFFGLDLTPLWRELPGDVADLVASDRGVLGIESQELKVWVDPGLVVYSRPLTDRERTAFPLPSSGSTLLKWTGPSPDSLTVSPSNIPGPFVRARLSDGRLVIADPPSGLVVSDGDSEQKIPGLDPWPVTVWEDRVLGVGRANRIHFWDPATGEGGPISPEALFGVSEIRLLAAADSGVTALATVPGETIASDRNVFARDGELEWRLTPELMLELHRAGERLTAVPVQAASASINGERLRLEVADQQIEVPIDDWLAAFATAVRLNPPATAARVAHSPDGDVWSLDSWRDITGASAIDPLIFATDTFILAVEQGTMAESKIGAWVGRRPSDRPG